MHWVPSVHGFPSSHAPVTGTATHVEVSSSQYVSEQGLVEFSQEASSTQGHGSPMHSPEAQLSLPLQSRPSWQGSPSSGR